MRWRLALVAILASGIAVGRAPAQDAAAPPPPPAAMRPLFNGRDLSGWDGDPRLWSVRDGVIHGETTADRATQGNTFLIWKDGTVRDFDLRFSFRCNATNNSGVQYRSRHVTEAGVKNPWVVRGYQHELRNETVLPNVAGFIYDEGGKRGRLCLVGERAVWKDGGKQVADATLVDAATFGRLFRLDDWNDVVIVADGPRIRHYLNGRLIVDFTDSPPTLLEEGVVALQLHAGKPMWAEFRDIRLATAERPSTDRAAEAAPGRTDR